MPLFSGPPSPQLQNGCEVAERTQEALRAPPHQMERRGPTWAWQLEQVIPLDSSPTLERRVGLEQQP